jgi:hypothetical protein
MPVPHFWPGWLFSEDIATDEGLVWVHNPNSDFKAACPLLSGALVAPAKLFAFYSRTAERRRGQCEGVNRIVSGQIFWGAVAWGDQISESCGPGVPPGSRAADQFRNCSGVKGAQHPDAYRYTRYKSSVSSPAEAPV